MLLLLTVSEAQAARLLRVVDDKVLEQSISDQLKLRRSFKNVDDAPTTILVHRRPADGALVYAAVTYGTPEAADKAWRRKLGLGVLTCALAVGLTSCGRTARPAVILTPPPVVAPPPAPPVPQPPAQPHALTWFGSWPCRPSCAAETAGWTNLVAVEVGCQDDVAYAQAVDTLQRDTRAVVVYFNGWGYGPTPRSRNGYYLREDAAACWQELQALIATYRARVAWLHLADEPDAVAWGDQPSTGYDPNLYNPIITAACALALVDFPDLPIGINYADVPEGLTVPACLRVVGIESYAADWARRWRAIEAKTAATIVPLPPAFLAGTPEPGVDDVTIASRVFLQADACALDPRCAGLLFFLYGWDDTTTSPEPFYTIAGGHLPLTRIAIEAVGRTVLPQH